MKSFEGYLKLKLGNDYALLAGGGSTVDKGLTIAKTLHIGPVSSGSYNEGIRLHESGAGWNSLIFCGDDNTGNSGSSDNTWGLFTSPSHDFYINRGTSSTNTDYRLSCIDSIWKIRNYTIYHEGNLPAYPTKSSWNYDDRYLKLTGGTLTDSDSVLNIKSTTSNSWIYFLSTISNTSAARASVGYYSNLAFLANEKTYARIGVKDDGTPVYWSTSNNSNEKILLHTGNVSPSLSAGTTDTNKIKVTVGNISSSEFTVPYATSANTASSANSVAWNNVTSGTNANGNFIVSNGYFATGTPGGGSSSTVTRYISAGPGYSKSSGRYGLKILSCDLSDCQSGLGLDLSGNGGYDMCVVTCASGEHGYGYLSFVSHWADNTTYSKLGYFKWDNGTVTFKVEGTATATKFINSSVNDDSYMLLAKGGTKALTTLFTDFSRPSNTNNLSITIGGTTLTTTLGARAFDSTSYLPLAGGTLTNADNILSLSSTNSNSWIYYYSTVSGTLAARASSGYYSGFAFIANEATYARIGVTDAGVPQYWDNAQGTHKYRLLYSANTFWGTTPDASGNVQGHIAMSLGNHLVIGSQNEGGNSRASYISAGAGYSASSGRYGVKIVCCDLSDCQSGLGQDLAMASGWSNAYNFSIAGCNSSSDYGYISFVTHKVNSTTYRWIGGFYDNAGTVQFKVAGNSYSTNFYTTSDSRKKQNIHKISDNIKLFEWKETGETSYGFVAQDLEVKHPELVNDDGNMKTVNYNAALSLVVAKLENRVKELEAKLGIDTPPLYLTRAKIVKLPSFSINKMEERRAA